MNANERMKRREDRLLRWENYLRRTRHVAFELALLVIVASIVLGLVNPDLGDEQPATFFAGLFFLLWGYVAHLKVRHIESIKRNRGAA